MGPPIKEQNSQEFDVLYICVAFRPSKVTAVKPVGRLLSQAMPSMSRRQQTAAGRKIKGLPAGGAADDKNHVTKGEMKKSAKVRVCLFVCLLVCLFASNQTRAAAAVAKTAASCNVPLICPATTNDIFKPIFQAECEKKK